MTYRELTRKLRRLGCAFDRQAGGSHEIWINTANNQEPLFRDTAEVKAYFSEEKASWRRCTAINL